VLKATRRRATLVVLAMLILAGNGIAWFVASQARTTEHHAIASQPPPPSEITAQVDAGPLAETSLFEGTISRSRTYSIAAVNTDGVITNLPLAVGATVTSGEVIVEVSGRPIFLLAGDFRPYRDLTIGDEGPDVMQLQRALSDEFELPVTGYFGKLTAAAVERLYQDAGYAPPETSVPFDSPIDGNVSSGDDVWSTTDAGSRSVVLPAAEVMYAERLPVSVGELFLGVGDDSDLPIGTLVAGDWEVVVPADSTFPNLYQLEVAEVELADGPIEGSDFEFLSIRSREVVASTDEVNESGIQSEREAVFGLESGASEIEVGSKQSVAITLEQSSAESVVVPVSALWENGAGSSFVTVVDSLGVRSDVEVVVELSWDGRAAIRAPDSAVSVGDQVLVGERN
jgi:peptidoglycan hydrolase-like protein with peptidoglycan-binding domain